MSAHKGDPGQFHSPAYRKRTGTHNKLSEEQTKATAKMVVELAKTISEEMLLSSAAEKAEKPKEIVVEKEIHAHQCVQCDIRFNKPSDLVKHV